MIKGNLNLELDKNIKVCYNIYMSNVIDVSDLINLTQAARYLEVSYMTVYRWKKSGKIKVVYIGNWPYVPFGELVRIKEGSNSA